MRRAKRRTRERAHYHAPVLRQREVCSAYAQCAAATGAKLCRYENAVRRGAYAPICVMPAVARMRMRARRCAYEAAVQAQNKESATQFTYARCAHARCCARACAARAASRAYLCCLKCGTRHVVVCACAYSVRARRFVIWRTIMSRMRRSLRGATMLVL